MANFKQMRLLLLAGGAALLATCAANQVALTEAQAGISLDYLMADIATLASDEFMGRRPGQPGGDLTVDFLVKRAREIGLEPGNGDSYLQDVPLINLKLADASQMTFTSGDGDSGAMTWKPYEDFTVQVRGRFDDIAFEFDDVVLAGYGVVDSALGWDQYGDLDVKGKVVIIFRADPSYLTGDSTVFNSSNPVRHNLFSTKFRAARAKGALAAFAVFDGEMSDSESGWEDVSGGNRASVRLASTEAGEAPEFISGYMNPASVEKLLESRGLDYKEQLMAATEQSYQPVELGYSVKLALSQTADPFTSHNVLGILPGSVRPDELIIYTAHWDAYGIDTTAEDDQIFNGAVDNGTGSASLLTLAKMFTGLEQRPERSILFLWVTSEEVGLLGSRHYAEHPIYPLGKSVANINIDMLLPFGQTHDVIVFGYGKSQLDGYVKRATKKLGMVVTQDPWPEQRFYYRSDHINFARKGLPALSMNPGNDHVTLGVDSTMARMQQWMGSRYHRPSDELDDTWDMAGIIDYLKITFDIGYTLSNQTKWPNWYKNDEFRPIRDESRANSN
ncbi:MAG: M28 family peptidase [Candidatus Marinimicrobia bacterium]|nr:M28 family peptidase [Candidatus Neomarinimicrobiota bacterium]